MALLGGRDENMIIAFSSNQSQQVFTQADEFTQRLEENTKLPFTNKVNRSIALALSFLIRLNITVHLQITP